MTIYPNASLTDFYIDEDGVSAFTDDNGETVILAEDDATLSSILEAAAATDAVSASVVPAVAVLQAWMIATRSYQPMPKRS